VFALGVAALLSTLLISQQSSLSARKGEKYTGRILSERAPDQLYLDIGPCGGTIIVFRKPYEKSPSPTQASCGPRKVDIYLVTQK
jgi:hypothetical protein